MPERFAVGQDSHAYEQDPEKKYSKPLVLGGVVFDGCPCLRANSDGDVVLHAITNAVSGLTCRNILGEIADEMCKKGITDSAAYLKVALKDLEKIGGKITHISVSIEALRPKFAKKIPLMRARIAEICGIRPERCGITATSGEGLTAFGKGEGIGVFAAVTAEFGNYTVYF